MLAQRQDSDPITKTIYELFQLIGTGACVTSALGVWAMALLAVILGRKLGAVPRVAALPWRRGGRACLKISAPSCFTWSAP